ncbi:MAG: hypothetical protein AAGE52_10480 [Myxococcota bacterium]
MRWLFAIALLVGCANQEVKGSLSQVYPLGFDDVRIRLYSSSLSIEYVKNDGSVPIRVSVDRSALDSGGRIDLLENGDITGRTSEDREIPRFSEGDIRVRGFRPEDGVSVEGSWDAEFPVNDTDTLGLSGKFSGSIEVVSDPGPPPPGRE